MTSRSIYPSLVALAAIVLSGSIALAQPPASQPAPPSPDGSAPLAAPIERQPPSDPGMAPGGMHPGGMHPGAMRPGMMRPGGGGMMANHANFRGPDHGDMGADRIAPEGMWWKNPNVVQKLALTADQVKRMDGIFQESRIQLIDLHANVQKQEVMLEPLLSANPVDTAKAMAQIDKVAQARADLEKANAKMLLGLRAVLTPDQWTKLHDHSGGFRGQGGPGGPGGQGGPGRGHGPQPGAMDNLVAPPMEP
jgi:Spy/CpxP family protein refolding chaperone